MKESLCPRCLQPVVKDEHSPFWPFCSKICKDSDLYQWFEEQNLISREITEEDLEDPNLARQMEEWQKEIGPIDPYDPRFS